MAKTTDGRLTGPPLPTVCDIKLDEDQYEVIAEMARERQFFMLEFDIRNHFKPGPVKYHNVIGVIKGYNFNYGEIWHTERDTYDKSISEYQEHTSVVTTVLVYGLDNLNHLLSREGLYADE